MFVRLADGVDPAAGRTALQAALSSYPTAGVQDQGTAAANRLQAIDQVLGMVTVLLLLTIVIAMLGIANTFALSMLERTREIGLLRAVGEALGPGVVDIILANATARHSRRLS